MSAWVVFRGSALGPSPLKPQRGGSPGMLRLRQRLGAVPGPCTDAARLLTRC